jgi:hypothetical protein
MAKTAAKTQTKSDRVRALLDEGKTVAEITRLVPGMGYAFAYGIAKRYGKAMTAAHRRQARQVVATDGKVSIRIVNAGGDYTGTVVVDTATGKVSRHR